MKKILALLGALLSLVYLLNPSAGFIEFIPDNILGIGNLDEAAVTAILIACLRALGFDILKFFTQPKKKTSEVIDIESHRDA